MTSFDPHFFNRIFRMLLFFCTMNNALHFASSQAYSYGEGLQLNDRDYFETRGFKGYVGLQ